MGFLGKVPIPYHAKTARFGAHFTRIIIFPQNFSRVASKVDFT
jgi:hypothetical protein